MPLELNFNDNYMEDEYDYDVSLFESCQPTCSASDIVSGSFRLSVSGKYNMRIEAISDTAPNIRYGRISKNCP